MNSAGRSRPMTRAAFFDWAEAQDVRYEFDGFAPVAMTGGNLRHTVMIQNVQAALRTRPSGSCRPLGPDAGIRTVGDAVRYPDAVVTCSRFDDLSRELPDPVVVFEVLSLTSGSIDRVVKLHEYRAVPSIRCYVILDCKRIAATVHARDGAGSDWTTTELADGQTLDLPDLGIDVPLTEFYAGTALAEAGPLP